MKGFIKTLEAIIASTMILASLLYFFTFDLELSDWSNALLQLEAEDSLATIEKEGSLSSFIKQNDKENLYNELKAMLPKIIGFSVDIVGIPNPDIYIGALKDEEVTWLDDNINNNIDYKERKINTHIKKMSLDDIEPETNIIFFSDYRDINGTTLNQFLSNGGSILLRDELTESDLGDEDLKNIFDLEWDNGIVNPSEDGIFYNYTDANITSFRLSNYFNNISGQPINTIFNFANVNKIAVDRRTIMIDSNGKSSFAKVNAYGITRYGKGRAVWIAEGTETEDMNNLIMSLIMWASGEQYNMDYPYEREKPDIYSTASYIVSDNEVYEIDLTFWRIFY